MGKNKGKNNVVLENIELKPQVIGNVYKKKSNLGRVIFIFIVFILVIYYINDISVFINDLIGKSSSPTIKDNINDKDNNNTDKPNNDNNNNNSNNDLEYFEFNTDLTITQKDLVLNNFQNQNNLLTFDLTNNGSTNINYSNRNFYIETYNTNKTLLERFKIDIGTIASKGKKSFSFDVKNTINYIVLTEINNEDYPNINLNKDDNLSSQLTCVKGIENIVYTFQNDELRQITHTISNSNPLDQNYQEQYNLYQNKIPSYNNMSGVSATFNGNSNGYTAVISINLTSANINNLDSHYYYSYKEEPKVIDFEMKTYGFTCK